MATKLYYNPFLMKEKNFIITREEFNAIWNKQTKEYVESDEYFNEWLDEMFASIELFNMTQKQKEKVKQDYYSDCKGEALKNLKKAGWKPYQLEEYTEMND